MTALGRYAVPEDIGNAIAALLADGNRWVTGQRIEVSGGVLDAPGPRGLSPWLQKNSDRAEQGGAGCLATAAAFSAEPAMLMVLGVALALLAAGRAGLPAAPTPPARSPARIRSDG